MKIIILSDTHGVLDARIAQEALRSDVAVHAGDIGGAAVLRSLRPRRELVAVRGNNDTVHKWRAEERRDLQALPAERVVDLPGGLLVVVHGDAHGPPGSRHRRLRESYPQARLIVYGHSHRLVVDREREPWVLNPGAAGRSRTYGGPSCVLLSIAGSRWQLRLLRFPPVASAHAPRPAG